MVDEQVREAGPDAGFVDPLDDVAGDVVGAAAPGGDIDFELGPYGSYGNTVCAGGGADTLG